MKTGLPGREPKHEALVCVTRDATVPTTKPPCRPLSVYLDTFMSERSVITDIVHFIVVCLLTSPSAALRRCPVLPGDSTPSVISPCKRRNHVSMATHSKHTQSVFNYLISS